MNRTPESARSANSFSNAGSIVGGRCPRAAAEELGVAAEHIQTPQRGKFGEAAAHFPADGFLEVLIHSRDHTCRMNWGKERVAKTTSRLDPALAMLHSLPPAGFQGLHGGRGVAGGEARIDAPLLSDFGLVLPHAGGEAG